MIKYFFLNITEERKKENIYKECALPLHASLIKAADWSAALTAIMTS